MSNCKRGDERIMRVTEVNRGQTTWVRVGDLVRCGDCVWADEMPEGGMPKCGKLHKRVPRDGYCHLGERMTNER